MGALKVAVIVAFVVSVINIIRDEILKRRYPTNEETRKKDKELQRRFVGRN